MASAPATTKPLSVVLDVPEQLVRVEVIDCLPRWDVSKSPLAKDKLP